jgi:hypothetical protein
MKRISLIRSRKCFRRVYFVISFAVVRVPRTTSVNSAESLKIEVVRETRTTAANRVDNRFRPCIPLGILSSRSTLKLLQVSATRDLRLLSILNLRNLVIPDKSDESASRSLASESGRFTIVARDDKSGRVWHVYYSSAGQVRQGCGKFTPAVRDKFLE